MPKDETLYEMALRENKALRKRIATLERHLRRLITDAGMMNESGEDAVNDTSREIGRHIRAAEKALRSDAAMERKP